jgi:hypothetical protein
VATNIIVTGVSLVRRSTGGLMDRALPADELARVHDILERFTAAGPVRFHALRTRRAATTSSSASNGKLREALGHATVFTHLEPLEDPASFADTELDRSAEPAAAKAAERG